MRRATQRIAILQALFIARRTLAVQVAAQARGDAALARVREEYREDPEALAYLDMIASSTNALAVKRAEARVVPRCRAVSSGRDATWQGDGC